MLSFSDLKPGKLYRTTMNLTFRKNDLRGGTASQYESSIPAKTILMVVRVKNNQVDILCNEETGTLQYYYFRRGSHAPLQELEEDAATR